MSLIEGSELFIKLIGDNNLSNTEKFQKTIYDLVTKKDGLPLSIEILAKNYGGSGLLEIENMTKDLGLKVNNPRELNQRLRSLEASFEYSISNLGDNLIRLLRQLILLQSPFPISSVMEIFNTKKEDIVYLYNHSLLTIIDSDEYGSLEEDYWLYTFHPAVRDYLRNTIKQTDLDLQFEYRHLEYRYLQTR